jgi:hypothetical protein
MSAETSLVKAKMSEAEKEKLAAEIVTRDPFSLAELNSVSDQDVTDLQEVLTRWNLDDMTWEDLDKFAFDGFDIRIIFQSIIKIIEVARQAAIADKKVFDIIDIKKEIFSLLSLNILKGNVTTGNFHGFTEEAQEEVKRLFKKYKIQMKPSKKQKKTAVTLPRLASALPYQTVLIAARLGRAFMGPFGSLDLPKFMFTSAFPSCIPTNGDHVGLLTFCSTCFTCDQTTVVKGVNYLTITDKQKADLLVAQSRFTDIALNSPALSDYLRLYIFTQVIKVRDYYPAFVKVAKKNSYDNIPTESKWNESFDELDKRFLAAHIQDQIDMASRTTMAIPSAPIVPGPAAAAAATAQAPSATLNPNPAVPLLTAPVAPVASHPLVPSPQAPFPKPPSQEMQRLEAEKKELLEKLAAATAMLPPPP